MTRRLISALVIISLGLTVAAFVRWRTTLVSRASGEFGGKTVVFELHERENGVSLHKNGEEVRIFAERENGENVKSSIEIEEDAGTVVVSYGDTVRKFEVDEHGHLSPIERNQSF